MDSNITKLVTSFELNSYQRSLRGINNSYLLFYSPGPWKLSQVFTLETGTTTPTRSHSVADPGEGPGGPGPPSPYF